MEYAFAIFPVIYIRLRWRWTLVPVPLSVFFFPCLVQVPAQGYRPIIHMLMMTMMISLLLHHVIVSYFHFLYSISFHFLRCENVHRVFLGVQCLSVRQMGQGRRKIETNKKWFDGLHSPMMMMKATNRVKHDDTATLEVHPELINISWSCSFLLFLVSDENFNRGSHESVLIWRTATINSNIQYPTTKRHFGTTYSYKTDIKHTLLTTTKTLDNNNLLCSKSNAPSGRFFSFGNIVMCPSINREEFWSAA